MVTGVFTGFPDGKGLSATSLVEEDYTVEGWVEEDRGLGGGGASGAAVDEYNCWGQLGSGVKEYDGILPGLPSLLPYCS